MVSRKGWALANTCAIHVRSNVGSLQNVIIQVYSKYEWGLKAIALKRVEMTTIFTPAESPCW